jgi:hypothetical protein
MSDSSFRTLSNRFLRLVNPLPPIPFEWTIELLLKSNYCNREKIQANTT